MRSTGIISAIGNILSAPFFPVSNNISTVFNDNLCPASLDKLCYIDNRISPLTRQYDFWFTHPFPLKNTASKRSLEQNQKKYQIQREYLKEVINDLHFLDDVIRPQIFESEISLAQRLKKRASTKNA
jgi:hypothetical protein